MSIEDNELIILSKGILDGTLTVDETATQEIQSILELARDRLKLNRSRWYVPFAWAENPLDQHDQHHFAPLHLAVFLGEIDIVVWLIDNGLDINSFICYEV